MGNWQLAIGNWQLAMGNGQLAMGNWQGWEHAKTGARQNRSTPQYSAKCPI
jgi:hypothetical protein